MSGAEAGLGLDKASEARAQEKGKRQVEARPVFVPVAMPPGRGRRGGERPGVSHQPSPRGSTWVQLGPSLWDLAQPCHGEGCPRAPSPGSAGFVPKMPSPSQHFASP